MKKIKIYIATLTLSCGIGNLFAQEASFIDGYHGGIYGHYPLWNTQFYVDNLATHPEWRINLEIEPETWDSVKVLTPEAYRSFQKIAVNSRVEFVNPAYGQPYAFNIQGESLIRHFEYGIKTLHKHFPEVQFTTYSSEEPCFTSCLPTILKSFGFKYAVLKCPNTCWGGYVAAYGGELVNWIGPDGTPMLTVPRYACETLQENSTWQTIAWNNSDTYINACRRAGIQHPVGMCLQDAGWKGGPMLGSGEKMKKGTSYRTWTEYIENVSNGKSNDNWRLSQEAIQANLMWGSQVMQRLAQAVRLSENRIVVAEKVDAMHFLSGGKATDPVRFDSAWRTLLLSQHHDCWIVPYNKLTPSHKIVTHDTQISYPTWADKVLKEWTPNTDQIASEVIREALKEEGGKKLILQVTNTTASPRKEIVQLVLPSEYRSGKFHLIDAKGEEVPAYFFEKEGKTIGELPVDIPSFGYVDYVICPKSEKKETPAFVCKGYQNKAGNYVLESDIYRIELNLSKGGCIKSLLYKPLQNKEFVDITSPYSFNELRGFFYEENRYRSTTEMEATVSIIEHTPYSISVAIKNEIAGQPCCQMLTLRQGEERIDGTIRIDWKGNPGIGEYKDVYSHENRRKANRRAFKNDQYKLLLLLPAALEGQQLYKNAPFDVCKSTLDNTFFDTWDGHKHNIIVNWVDVTDREEKYGLSLFSDHTTSYAHGKDFPLALNIQYSGKGLWGADYEIEGPTTIHYALMPHAKTWDKAFVWSKSNYWNEPLLVNFKNTISDVKTCSFIQLDKQGYEMTSVKVRDKDVYIRLFNAESDETPVHVKFDFPVSRVESVKLNEELVDNLDVQKGKNGNSVKIAIPRFGFRTLKVSLL